MKNIIKNVVFVRSTLDLGDFNDDEKNLKPSLTDPSQDEPIEALVARMLRGEIVSRGMPQYDTDGSASAEDVFSRQSAVTKEGFDLADAPAILKRAQKADKAIRKAKEVPPTPEAEKPKGEAPKAPPAAK